MSLASVQSLINQGYAQAATFLGETFTWYRGTSALTPPLTTSSGTMLCYLDVDPKFSANKVNGYAKPTWYAAFDRTNNQVGDYIVSANGTVYFINSMCDLVPTQVVQCSHVASFYRPSVISSASATPFDPTVPGSGYAADSANGGLGTQIVNSWPIALLQGTKGERSDLTLPTDTRMPWYQVLIPSLPALHLLTNDQMVDEIGNRYTISSIENTPLGYRLTAAYSGS